MNATPERFTAEQRNDDWTVRDHEQHRLLVHKAHWAERAARHTAEVLNARPYHAEEWEWEA